MDRFHALFYSDYGPGSPLDTAFMLLFAFVLGHVIGWIYMWTHKVLSYSQTFVASLVIIPVIVSLMISLMSGSLFVAFGLLAVFAVVRFRNVLKDTRDTAFILWAIVEGLAVGTEQFSRALIGAIGIALVFFYLRLTAFGSRHRYDAVLSLQLTGDLASGIQSLKDILRRHCTRTQLASERHRSDEGLDLSYRLLMRDPTRNGELQWDLMQLDVFQNVSFFMRDEESEV